MRMFSKARRTPTPAARVIFSDPQLHAAVETPDPARLMWMEELREFLRGPKVRLADINYIELLYVDYCSRWHATPEQERWNPNMVINALGIVLGDYVRKTVPGLSWKIIAQQGPTTLVLVTEDDLIVGAPLEYVAERWMDHDLAWVRDYPAFVLGPQYEGRQPLRRVVAPPTARVRV